MKTIVAGLFMAGSGLAGPVLAAPGADGATPLQTATAVVVSAPVAQVTLPGNSMVVLEATDQANSGALRVGSKLNLSVVYDVKVGGAVVIPAGSRAEAEVSWRTGRGAFGAISPASTVPIRAAFMPEAARSTPSRRPDCAPWHR